MRWPSAAALAWCTMAACAGARPGLPPAAAGAAELADHLAERAAEALAADARLDRADSLYIAEAEIIADGARRAGPPRFAGIAGRGQVSVGSSRVELAGAFALVLMEYRWLSAAEDLASEAHATVFFTRQPDGRWRISHAHSSAER